MSEHVWCHGPSCHEQHTQDRIRGTSGSKVLRTRKIKLHPEYINMYSYFVVMVVTMTLQINTLSKL
jgi:hypothetical protein